MSGTKYDEYTKNKDNRNKNREFDNKKIISLEVKPGCVIYNNRTIFLKEPRALVFADLHLGYEGAMEKDGVFFPKCQLNIIKRKLSKIIEKQNPKEVIILGD
ncbi:MAG: hypothetical protein QXT63_02900, partial [Thermoplasmata archaeon]